MESSSAAPPDRTPSLYLFQPGPWARFCLLLRGSFVAAYEDNCFGIAKGAAYSGLLSFFPVLASVAAILVTANAEAVSQALSEFLFEVVPPGTQDLVQYQFATRGQRPGWLLVAATLLSVWGGSGAMLSLMEGFQAAYRLPTGRPILKQRAVAALLVFAVALPAVGASVLIVFGNRSERTFLQWIGFGPDDETRTWLLLGSRTLRYLIALAAIVLVTCLMYYIGPNRRMRLRNVWPGALLTTLLWLLATSGFAWYVRNIANYNVLYGGIGAVIALLVWMYLLAIIALFGCEFNAEWERVRMLSASASG